ncbi:MAG TPA: hypothetical protein VMC08_00910 [Bacteroidales bacterium]|nr:hypothetical protein [Bacteroidales bacterium]
MSGIIQKIRNFQWHRAAFILLVAAVVIGADGCKTSGKLTKKERKAQIEAAKAQLTDIINGTSTKTLEEQQRIVNDIVNKHLNDKDLNGMITQAQNTLKKAFAEREKLRQQQIDAARSELLDMLVNRDNKSADELESELAKIKAMNLGDKGVDELIGKVEQKIKDMRSHANIPLKQQLETSFQGIADAGKAGNLTQSASLIKTTLALFASDDVPVLIIISREGDIVDYDKPTNIHRYLDFLKDQKVNRNNVDSYQLDENGKIKELDLIKK